MMGEYFPKFLLPSSFSPMEQHFEFFKRSVISIWVIKHIQANPSDSLEIKTL